MKNLINKKVYAEVFEVLKNSKEFRECIPDDIVKHIRNQSARSKI